MVIALATLSIPFQMQMNYALYNSEQFYALARLFHEICPAQTLNSALLGR